MEEGKMKDCLKTNGLGGEFSDDHTVLQWEITQLLNVAEYNS